ncbi:MAG: hypothetical protein NVS3B20_23610 [Polyangiales bacterium]
MVVGVAVLGVVLGEVLGELPLEAGALADADDALAAGPRFPFGWAATPRGAKSTAITKRCGTCRAKSPFERTAAMDDDCTFRSMIEGPLSVRTMAEVPSRLLNLLKRRVLWPKDFAGACAWVRTRGERKKSQKELDGARLQLHDAHYVILETSRSGHET